MNAPLVTGLLFLAAVMGDTVNYGIGNFIGGKVIQKYPEDLQEGVHRQDERFLREVRR